MEIYRKGQGLIARWIAASILLATAFFGCREIYVILVNLDVVFEIGGYEITWGEIVAGGVFLLCSIGIFFVLNHHKVVDYLIETETEMQKVSWPEKKELWGSTMVVLITLLITAVFVSLTDVVLQEVMYGWILK